MQNNDLRFVGFQGIAIDTVKRIRALLAIIQHAKGELDRAYEEEQTFIEDVQNACKFASDDLDVYFDSMCEVASDLETALEACGHKRDIKTAALAVEDKASA